jgi:hypothetical protein
MITGYSNQGKSNPVRMNIVKSATEGRGASMEDVLLPFHLSC